MSFTVSDIDVVPGIGGYWSNDQAAVQSGARRDGFVFEGAPVTSGFSEIREPSEALCCIFHLEGGYRAYGDCLTVFNSGHAGRPPPLRSAVASGVEAILRRDFVGRTFSNFREASAQLDRCQFGTATTIPVSFGVSQALLDAAAVTSKQTIAEVVATEFGRELATKQPFGFAGSCGGDWHSNVDKAILRKLEMFPQSAIQTEEQCNALPEFVGFIKQRIIRLGNAEYRPNLHFDFHGALGKKYGNDLDAVFSYIADLAESCAPFSLYCEDPFEAHSAGEAADRMAQLRDRLENAGTSTFLIADQWANGSRGLPEFLARGAVHAVQIKLPDNGSVARSIEAALACEEHGVRVYLGGSCNETDLSARITVHIGYALGAWSLLTKPGLGFDEGLMILTNEAARLRAILAHNRRKTVLN